MVRALCSFAGASAARSGRGWDKLQLQERDVRGSLGSCCRDAALHFTHLNACTNTASTVSSDGSHLELDTLFALLRPCTQTVSVPARLSSSGVDMLQLHGQALLHASLVCPSVGVNVYLRVSVPSVCPPSASSRQPVTA